MARKKRPAPRAPLSKERVLREAVLLADAGGVDSLTMRSLADRLGVEAMSLYHHVPNKEEILTGMVDLVFAGIPVPEDADWRTAMRQRARAVREALFRHPWALGLLGSRRNPGAATLRHHDAAIGCLRRSGFSIPMVAHALALLDSYVFGFVVEEQNLPLSTPEEVQEVAGSLLEHMGADAYPHLTEFAVEHVMKPGYDFAGEFEYGLEVILDGLEERSRQDRERSAVPTAHRNRSKKRGAP
jgi:AcrR family transcriptional regulator